MRGHLLGIGGLLLATSAASARPLDDAACKEARAQRNLSTMRACAPRREQHRPDDAAAYWMAVAAVALDPEVEDVLGMEVRRDEAIAALGHASRLTPNDPAPLRRRARLADDAGELRLLREIVADLERVAPDDPEGEAYRAVLCIEDGEWSRAEEALDHASDHGLATQRVAAIRAELDRRQPLWRRHRYLAMLAAIATLLGLLVKQRLKRGVDT